MNSNILLVQDQIIFIELTSASKINFELLTKGFVPDLEKHY